MSKPGRQDQTKIAASRIGRAMLWLFIIGMVLNTCADQKTMTPAAAQRVVSQQRERGAMPDYTYSLFLMLADKV